MDSHGGGDDPLVNTQSEQNDEDYAVDCEQVVGHQGVQQRDVSGVGVVEPEESRNTSGHR